MSQRGGQDWSVYGYPDQVTGRMSYDGDLWYTTNVNGEWQKPKVLPPTFNTSLGEDEPSISVDGQKIYFQSWRYDWKMTGGPYYVADLEGNKWKAPVGLGGNITRFFIDQEVVFENYVRRVNKRRGFSIFDQMVNQSHFFGTDGMSVSPDGKTFIVAIASYDRGYKNFELYISHKNSAGEWSYPEPLSINTRRDEISVFIAGDNKTLYFASKGHGSMGGYDIFKTTLEEGTRCGEVVNLGSPYNTRNDDYGFIVNSLGTKGYFVRNGQIYEAELNEKAKSTPTLVINGVVKNQYGEFLSAEVKLLADSTSKPLSIRRSNSYSGEFSFSTPWKSGQKKLIATLQDGRQQIVDFIIDPSSSNPQFYEIIFPEEPVVETPRGIEEPTPPPIDLSQQEEEVIIPEAEIEKKLNDPNLKVNATFEVENLYFDADTSNIQPTSYPTLNQLATSLIDHPGIIVEIGGHTNGLPPHNYCDELSQARAKAVYEYLINKGVTPNQVQYKGYGKRQPIANNETTEGRRKNQRVEVKILEIRE
ncbi:MAG: OmpA family protein [Bacteroidota bacterium]